jgi:uncharacterized protein YndB with AHSA1/START domain
MGEVRARIEASPQQVFEVLADGWQYCGWVVGASHIRNVDQGWPAVGTRIHHSVGPWPVSIQDETVVRAMEPGRLLELSARLWPLGKATVRLELRPSGAGTEVIMTEVADGGPAALMPRSLQSLVLRPRNEESLRRLAHISERRHTTP